MPCDAPPSPTLIERIERALVLLAYFMEQDGDVHLAMYEKFEEELAELINKEDIRARARRRLQAYSETSTSSAHYISARPELINLSVQKPSLPHEA